MYALVVYKGRLQASQAHKLHKLTSFASFSTVPSNSQDAGVLKKQQLENEGVIYLGFLYGVSPLSVKILLS